MRTEDVPQGRKSYLGAWEDVVRRWGAMDSSSRGFKPKMEPGWSDADASYVPEYVTPRRKISAAERETRKRLAKDESVGSFRGPKLRDGVNKQFKEWEKQIRKQLGVKGLN